MLQNKLVQRYLVDRRQLWVWYGLAGLLLLPPVAMMLAPHLVTHRTVWEGSQQAGAALLVVAMPFAVLLSALARRSRLLISERGIEVVNPGFSALVQWQDIECIRLEGKMTGLILKQPYSTWQTGTIPGGVPRSVARRSVYSTEHRRLIEQGLFVDLKPFAARLRSLEFAEQLAALAPDVAIHTADGLFAA